MTRRNLLALGAASATAALLAVSITPAFGVGGGPEPSLSDLTPPSLPEPAFRVPEGESGYYEYDAPASEFPEGDEDLEESGQPGAATPFFYPVTSAQEAAVIDARQDNT
ncbi:hypothetical protein GCM10025875_37730 [Litorihabitans aurantiacus]|uniref:Uncharacterized protein n=1 Tax=Litorihabitans aurantiacus TaxID=1930061 RepID=A0AA37XJM7_9MICO|nr:hypothetical protein GCM10025875_36420 [Litorihabitans aurantiacus]GMA33717.1 hypothetical protein GCM10025875_37090 [Litorihabitans aurantiacus]GMA33781.1 hypothetical protein GCM10025875_37730 [Litorihabitans aurantiacus]